MCCPCSQGPRDPCRPSTLSRGSELSTDHTNTASGWAGARIESAYVCNEKIVRDSAWKIHFFLGHNEYQDVFSPFSSSKYSLNPHDPRCVVKRAAGHLKAQHLTQQASGIVTYCAALTALQRLQDPPEMAFAGGSI